MALMSLIENWFVSTHSRLKAAGSNQLRSQPVTSCFNTQPPKGGWATPATIHISARVSTHSRLKAAGKNAKNRRPKY